MSLEDNYNAKIALADIEEDAEQRALLGPLNTLAEALNHPQKKGFLSLFKKKKPVRGFYLFGKVGVGKTFLLDLLYESVTIVKKKRYHFYDFMQHIDADLRKLQGKKDPLDIIAKRWSQSTDLLCLDEFLVEDVASAMILGELLPLLLSKGLVLVMTSNTLPQDLYRDGPQRQRFLPAIAAISLHCQICTLQFQRDYRLGREHQPNAYLCPLNEANAQTLAHQYDLLALGETTNIEPLTIQKRIIPCVKYAPQIVWFDFKMLCSLPRSPLDYLEIANRFDTILLANVPQLGEKDTVGAILLCHLIDVIYDQGIRLIVSAEVPIEALYLSGEVTEDFKRTVSRLQEMQSEDYLKRHPKRTKCE